MKNKIYFVFLHLCFIAAQGVFQKQCFTPGECVNSHSIDILSLADEFECLAHCQDHQLCEWFTFIPDPQACHLFKECTSIGACDGCLSGKKSCEDPEPQCWIPGKCEGNIIVTTDAESANGCLRLCKNEAECKWFTFLEPEKQCFLLSECEILDETSEGSVSGERRCQEEVTTTTSPPFPVYSKILVAHGYDKITDVEIVDLLSSETTCQNPEDVPFANYLVPGGLGFHEKPLICGGGDDESLCNLYEDGVWKSSDSLQQGREGFAITKSPFQDGSKLFVTGGFGETSDLSSCEVLTENGWGVSVDMPIPVSYHCMATINSTSVMVIGGYQDGPLISAGTFIFNSETNIWTDGPRLISRRTFHSCGSILKNSQSEDKSLIAVGGYDGSHLGSVEILDLDSNAWRSGPRLPFAIYGAALVENQSGGVVLIGGSDGNMYLDTLYKLPHAGSDATWELMPQKLKTKRQYHTAFLIPDDIAACN